MFMVSGGVFTDMSFTEVEAGKAEVYGPFETREEAVNVWRGKMGLQIDTCEHRLFLTKVPAANPCAEIDMSRKFRRLDFVTILDGPYAGEKGRIYDVLSDKQYGVKVLTGPDANQRGTYVAQERQLETDENPEMSACDKCGAEYPSAPLGTIHKCGRCSGGYCYRKKAN
jgi:hypothetical protein